LAREYRIQEQLIIYLASKGITLIDARTGEDVTEAINSDPMKKALIQMQGIFAELEKNLLVKKLKIARESRRKSYGKCEGRKGWNDVPEKRETVLLAIKSYRKKPKGKRRMTFIEIADELNKSAEGDESLGTITGKQWTGPMIQNFIQRYDKR
jgi:DNA invertase Pin-like site-specific DNA recombinase